MLVLAKARTGSGVFGGRGDGPHRSYAPDASVAQAFELRAPGVEFGLDPPRVERDQTAEDSEPSARALVTASANGLILLSASSAAASSSTPLALASAYTLA